MIYRRFSRFLTATASLAVLASTAACSTMEGAYNSMSDTLGIGSEPQSAQARTGVRSPAAAPVEDVKTAEIDTPAQPVELGRLSDGVVNTAPAEKIIPIRPSAPAPQRAIAEAAPVTMPKPTAPIASNTAALLTIRFNQPHVNYDDALAQSVAAAESVKPGVLYEVLSTVPDLSSLPPDAQQKLSVRAQDNLRNVVMKMQQQGVSGDRIRIADQTIKIRSQEIRVFVR